MTNLQKMHFFGNLRTITQEAKKTNYPIFSSPFWALAVSDIHFCIWKLSKFIFIGSPLWSILVCKIPELWRWKLWDQNFVSFKSGYKQIKKSKKPGFTFSLELRTKFVWSHSLWQLLAKKKQKTFFLVLWKMSFSTRLTFLKCSSQNSQNHMMSEW